MKNFEKKYQLWTTPDGVAYTAEEYDTLQECITAPKSDPWYVTKRVSIAVTDAEEITITNNPMQYARNVLQMDATNASNGTNLPTQEAPDPVLERYLNGPTGTVTESISA